MAESARFWNWIAKRYAKQPVADEESYQRKLEVTRDYMRPDMDVLEFGCGTGSTAIAQAPFVKHIRATDISPKMIEIAKQKAAAADIQSVTFEQVSVGELQVPDQSYDMVMAHSILHLLEDKDQAIAKVHKMLKPDGIFVSSTVCLGESRSFFLKVGPIGHFLGVLPYLNVFKRAELEESISNHGFEIDHVWQPGDGTSSLKSVFIIAKRK